MLSLCWITLYGNKIRLYYHDSVTNVAAPHHCHVARTLTPCKKFDAAPAVLVPTQYTVPIAKFFKEQKFKPVLRSRSRKEPYYFGGVGALHVAALALTAPAPNLMSNLYCVE
jgi:hypothetical protein